nr:lantibiotic dehydratase [Streptacidiphilus albus]
MEWLRQAWAERQVADALGYASPSLEAQVRSLCASPAPDWRRTRRAVLSTGRYLLRMTGRATPTGLLAGIAPARFADRTAVRWGQHHRTVARADGAWLSGVIDALDRDHGILEGLEVVANSVITIRDDRVIVPYQPHATDRGTGAVEVSLRYSPPVRTALQAAQHPIRLTDLSTTVRAQFPQAAAEKVTALLAELVACRVLITSLHAPSTETDALGHLVRALEAAEPSPAVPLEELREIHALLERHHAAGADKARALREDAAGRMTRLAPSRRNPVALDLRVDADVALPREIARESERAALLLARLTANPFGLPAWSDYHHRFYQRYGGGLVPLLDVVADSGIGWPAGYPGTEPLERRGHSRRDAKLLALAQAAALDGRTEIVLDGALIGELERYDPTQARLPAHLELCVRVDASTPLAVDRGDFLLTVLSVSRSAGVLSGRFLHLLDRENRTAIVEDLADLPGSDEDTLNAQLSFPPLDPASAHVTRSGQLLPTIISMAEHRETSVPGILTARDLAVGCDGNRLYLAVPALGRRVEAWGLHALNLRRHTPPLARLITELSHAQGTQIADFDWGEASDLPFLPRLRHRRIVLSPARWRLTTAELPSADSPFAHWDEKLSDWRERRRLPDRVHLTDGDWRLPLNLDLAGHRVLLREHLTTHGQAALIEAPAADAAGWCQGRPHEVVVPLAITAATGWPPLPCPTPARVLDRGHGHTPGASPVLLAKLGGDVQRQDQVLSWHLPTLLAHWGEPPRWWFLRFREEREHQLRLYVALPTPAAEDFAQAAARISAWADDLRCHGLLREVSYGTYYPQTGRWGSGPALTAAEQVLAADSAVVLTQLAQPALADRKALVAVHFAAMALAFTGDADSAMTWLIDHVPATAPSGVRRQALQQAVRLADPRADFRALRETAHGAAMVDAWTPRSQALADYRSHLPGPDTQGIDPDAALDSLLHTHYLRAYSIDPADKAVCLYLARAAALAHNARTGGSR